MLVPFPQNSWNTFADGAMADLIIGDMVKGEGVTKYLNLSQPEKEAILVQTAMQIRACPSIKLPTEADSILNIAQCYLIVHALEVDMMSYDANGRAITNETVDVISVSYDARYKGLNSDFPPMVRNLLSGFGCSGVSGGFKQVPLGRA